MLPLIIRLMECFLNVDPFFQTNDIILKHTVHTWEQTTSHAIVIHMIYQVGAVSKLATHYALKTKIDNDTIILCIVFFLKSRKTCKMHCKFKK